MISRRFTLSGLLLFITFAGVALAIVVPVWRGSGRPPQMGAQVAALAVSADGSTAAAMMGDGTLRIWDLDRRKLRATLATRGGTKDPLALSFDGKLAAVASSSAAAGPAEIAIWDIAAREPLRVLSAPFVTGFSFSPIENLLAVENGSSLALHDLDDSAAPKRSIASSGSATFSPDGRTIALGERDGIHFYDTASLVRGGQAAATEVPALCIAFSPDGKTLAVRESAFTLREIDMDDLATRAARRIPFDLALPYDLAISDFALTYLPGGRALAVPRGAGLAIVDAETLQPLKPGEEFRLLAAGLRGQNFVVSDAATVDLYDAGSLRRVKRLLYARPQPHALLPLIGLAVWVVVFKLWTARKQRRSGSAAGQASGRAVRMS